MLNILLKGHDTTAMSTSWALYLIGSHPDIQKKVHEELDRIFGKHRKHLLT